MLILKQVQKIEKQKKNNYYQILPFRYIEFEKCFEIDYCFEDKLKKYTDTFILEIHQNRFNGLTI